MAAVCVDASVILDLLLPTARSAHVDAIWQGWAGEGIELIAPPLVFYETTSVLREWVYRGAVTLAFGTAAFERFFQIDLRIVTYSDLHIRAWQFATELNLPKAYDAHYLAAASQEGCEFWTTDRRLFRSVRHQLPWVRLAA